MESQNEKIEEIKQTDNNNEINEQENKQLSDSLDLFIEPLQTSQIGIDKIYKRISQIEQEKSQEFSYDSEESINLLVIEEDFKKNLKQGFWQVKQILRLIQDLLIKFSQNNSLRIVMEKLIKSVMILNIQYSQIVAILQTNNDLELQQVLGRFFYLDQQKIQINNKDQINLFTLKQCLQYIDTSLLKKLIQYCQSILNLKKLEEDHDFIIDLRIVNSKLVALLELFPFVVTFDKSDIFSYDFTDKEWYKLLQKGNMQTLQIAKEEDILKSFKTIQKGILLANAMVTKGSEQSNSIMKEVVEKVSAVYYILDSSSAKKKAEEFFAEPDQERAFKVWNMLDKGVGKHAIVIAFPTIKYNQKIYIPRLMPQITLEKIKKELLEGKINKLNEENDPIPLIGSLGDLDFEREKLFIKDEINRVQVRILAPQKLISPSQFDNKKGQKSTLNKVSFGLLDNPTKFFDKIIIQIHGGGFVAMSSRTHQTYTRKWVNDLDVPLFSIDYRKAQKFPYPHALDDCWQAYNWIINYVHLFFNVKPSKVILVGDSAGGNLILALTLRCIKEKIRVPDAIFPIYPALNLNQQKYTPSILHALDDVILPHTFLKLCLEAYCPKSLDLDPTKDPFLSPSQASDELLKLLPKIRMMVGTSDPLHDDTVRFFKKLNEMDKDVQLVIYKYFPHGFLNYDNPSGMKEAAECVKGACLVLRDLLN